MKYLFPFILCLLYVPVSQGGDPASSTAGTRTIELGKLVDEALARNPEIKAALHQMIALDAKVPQATGLPDPELTYMREQMPGFSFKNAMMERIELMQMIHFPSKVSKMAEIAEIQADHAHHEHLEKVNEVIAKLKGGYVELWFVQQSVALNAETVRLLRQLANAVRTRYSVGDAPQPEVLKAYVELSRMENQAFVLRQKELSTKAMLMGILDRRPEDTLDTATLPEEVLFTASLDTLESLALQVRPMLVHDSMMVEEAQAMLSLTKREYLPDLKLAVQYVRIPETDFRGWSLIAGISIPFAPWTLGKAGGRVEEATETVNRNLAAFRASRAMVLAGVRDLYYRAQGEKRQMEMYRGTILPQARQSFQASLIGYQTGKTDFLMLLDSHRTLVDLTLESLMARMQFEQSVAELERTVGVENVATMKP